MSQIERRYYIWEKILLLQIAIILIAQIKYLLGSSQPLPASVHKFGHMRSI